jgi:hypothetical protein
MNENEKKYKCKTSIIDEGDLEMIAYAEVSRSIFGDTIAQVLPQSMFMVGFYLEHGDIFGKTFPEIRDQIVAHVKEHNQCKEIFDALLEEEKNSQLDFLNKKGIENPAKIENDPRYIYRLLREYYDLRFHY